MATPLSFMMSDLKEKYDGVAASPAFTRLYESNDQTHMFAVLHKRLNEHFTDINDRAQHGNHYWAENSRDLLSLMDEIDTDLYTLTRAGVPTELVVTYRDVLERCRPWLSRSGGSTIPDDFEPIQIAHYEPVFTQGAGTLNLAKEVAPIKLKMRGEGSHALVYSYVDPDYGIKFAVKRAKQGLTERDLTRFKNEFSVMKKLSFPYVVEVYKYDDARNEYRMEFCDRTLRDYVAERNGKLSFSARKRIALQFLYGINYIHFKGYLHRDISLQNVLLKVFDSGAVLVKLSDFGLVKDQSKVFTMTQTEMRGTIRDPLLDRFKDYGVLNEMYAIAYVLSYVFTGRVSLTSSGDEVSRIVQKCAAHSYAERYQTVAELIADVERLDAPPTGAPAA